MLSSFKKKNILETYIKFYPYYGSRVTKTLTEWLMLALTLRDREIYSNTDSTTILLLTGLLSRLWRILRRYFTFECISRGLPLTRGGGWGCFPYILLNEIQTKFSQLAKRSARVFASGFVYWSCALRQKPYNNNFEKKPKHGGPRRDCFSL